MKIFENNLEINALNKLYSKRILKILKEIAKQNKHVVLITPFTKYSDLFNFKKDNLLSEIINDKVKDYQLKIIDEQFIIELIRQINSFLNFELLDYNLEYEKIIKTVLEISNNFIEEAVLPLILQLLSKFATKRLEVVVAGFEYNEWKIYDNLDLLYLIDNLQNQNLNFGNLQALWIDNFINNSVFVVEDQYKLLSWLELQAKTIINCQQLNNYFSGVLNYDSFLIEKCLQKISKIDL